MDPCHINTFKKDLEEPRKSSRKSRDKMMDAAFRKDIQDIQNFLKLIEYNAHNVDYIHKMWNDMMKFRMEKSYNYIL
jgi:hypothetical protein